MVSRVIPVEPFDLVVFGGTGDLARRKILPALFRRFRAGQIGSDARIIGAARSELEDAEYRDFAAEAITEAGYDAGRGDDAAEMVSRFLSMVAYVTFDARGDTGWDDL